jgi:hypothetical protein
MLQLWTQAPQATDRACQGSAEVSMLWRGTQWEQQEGKLPWALNVESPLYSRSIDDGGCQRERGGLSCIRRIASTNLRHDRDRLVLVAQTDGTPFREVVCSFPIHVFLEE